MSTPARTRRFRWLLGGESIGGRLLRWFIIIAVAPLLLVLVVTWKITNDAVETVILDSLSAIAEQKADRLEAYAQERIQSVTSMTISPGFLDAVADFTKAVNPNGTIDEKIYQAAVLKHRIFLDFYANSFGYPRLYLLTPEGRFLYSTNDERIAGQTLEDPEWRETGLAKALNRARTLLQADVSEPRESPKGGRPLLYVTGPLISRGRVAAMVAVELDPTHIDDIITDESGLGDTGETVCGACIGANLVVTAPTRFDPDAAFNMRLPLGSPRMPRLQAAARGIDFTGYGTDYRGARVLGAWTYVPSLRWGMCVKMDVSEASALPVHQQIATIIVALICVIPAAWIASMVAKSISRPVASAASATERVADGDLSVPVQPIGRGEPLQLLTSLRTAVSNLGSLLGRVRTSGRELLATSGSIRSTAQRQDEVAQGFGSNSSQIAAAVAEMTSTGRELAGTMSLVAEAATNAAAAAGRGREGLSDLGLAMGQLRQATDAVAHRLTTIRERAGAINSVVTTITKVADQTNLLSINAAIEAEKAGRYGLGFQVVAREINRLADQTAESTTDIERIVAEMQEAVAEGVTEMSRFGQVVDRGVNTADQIGVRLSEVIRQVEDLKSRFERVSEGMDSQSEGARQISDAMGQLSDGALRTAAAVQEFVAASRQLEQSAKGLEDEVARFKLPEDSNHVP